MSNLLEVVVLPRYAQTFLAVGHSPAFRHTVAKDYILELIHSGVGKHQRRVILRTIGAEGTILWPLPAKKFLNDSLISFDVIMFSTFQILYSIFSNCKINDFFAIFAKNLVSKRMKKEYLLPLQS